MVLRPYEARLAVDGNTLEAAPGATGLIYARDDTAFTTPLTALDSNGLPVELTANSMSVLPNFWVEDHTAVNWRSGDWVFPLTSSEPIPGAKGDAGPAVTGTELVGDKLSFVREDGVKTPPVTLPIGPGGSDSGVAGYITTPGSATNTALSAATAEIVEPLARRWAPSGVFLGDSNTVIGTDVAARQYGMSFPSLAAAMSKGRWVLSENAGVASDTVQMIADRVQTQVLDKRPGFCFVLAGSNSTTKGYSHYAEARSVYETQIIQRILNAGIPVILSTIPPRNNTRTTVAGVNTGPEVYQLTLAWNVFVRSMAAKYRLPLVDLYAIVTDPSTGNFKTGYTGDGVHWGYAGVMKVAEAVEKAISTTFPTRIVPLEQDRYSVVNMAPDPLFLGPLTSGGGGRYPAGFNGSSAAPPTVEVLAPVDGDGLDAGKWLKLGMSGTATRNVNLIRTITDYSAASGLTIKTGDRIGWGFRFKYSKPAVDETTYFTVSCRYLDSAGNNLKQVTPMNQWRSNVEGVLWIEDTLPAGTVSLRLDIGFSAGTMDLWIGQLSIYDLTAMGIPSLTSVDNPLPAPAMVAPPVGAVTPVPAPEPTVGAYLTSDTFNRADTTSGTLGSTDGGLGGTSGLAWSPATQLQVLSNEVGSTGITTTRFSSVDHGTVDHYAEVKLIASDGGVLVRAQSSASTPDCYYLRWVASTSRFELGKVVGGTASVIWSSATTTFTYGQTIGLGVKGGTLYAYQNGVLINTSVDGSLAGGTRAGIRSPFSGATMRMDDFAVNSFA